MRTISGVLLLLLAWPLTVAAQPPPPPPPSGGMVGDPVASEPKMRFEIGLIAGLPQQDLDEADTSPGINIQFHVNVAPNISIFGGARYFAIQAQELDDAGIDFANYDFDVGGRYMAPISPTAKFFGEAMVIYSTISLSGMGEEITESGVGFGARAGGMFSVSGNTNIGAAISYTTASIEDGDAGWLGLEGFVSFGF